MTGRRASGRDFAGCENDTKIAEEMMVDENSSDRLLAMVEERTRNIANDVTEIKADVKGLVRVSADHERRIIILEEKQKGDETERDSLKRFLMPILQYLVSGGLGAAFIVIAQHWFTKP